MLSSNKIIIAAAGSGKTSKIVDDALGNLDKRSLLVTYTNNNTNEIRNKIECKCRVIPKNLTVKPWFTFLLDDFVRPYQNLISNCERIVGIQMVNGQSTKYIKKNNLAYYINKNIEIYTDKISIFGFECNERTGGLVINRLERIYDQIYIDEIQDLAGYDLELIDALLESKIRVTLVGDHRQVTYQTNYSKKNKQFSGDKIINKFRYWENRNFCKIDYLPNSYRCNQKICDLADSIYPDHIDFPRTKSCNTKVTGHDGIFIVRTSKVSDYIHKYKPQILRYNRRSKFSPFDEKGLNFGDSKGLTFDRVLIISNGRIKKFLETGCVEHLQGDKAKYYVGITRAKFSVAFIYDDDVGLSNVNIMQ